MLKVSNEYINFGLGSYETNSVFPLGIKTWLKTEHIAHLIDFEESKLSVWNILYKGMKFLLNCLFRPKTVCTVSPDRDEGFT